MNRVRRATLSDLVNGKSALSPEMALRIEKAFGVKNCCETIICESSGIVPADSRRRRRPASLVL